MSRIDRAFPLNWSKAKDGLYWREWAAVKRANKRVDRHELHVQALGHDKSHVDFTNRDFDKVLAEFRSISRPSDLISQLDALEGRKRRLVFGIRRTACKMKVDENYILTIIENQTGRKDELDQLDENELENIRIALCLQLRRSIARKELQAGMIILPQARSNASSSSTDGRKT